MRSIQFKKKSIKVYKINNQPIFYEAINEFFLLLFVYDKKQKNNSVNLVGKLSYSLNNHFYF